ncbi:MAG: hypothetical protein JXN64_07220 [Spirochaetes bacterium]|nr:hypothetical protein [Spirochaetota bacterium]
MKIIYYTSGITGWGRVVRGISVANALKRKGINGDFTIISSIQPVFQFEEINHIVIPFEHENILFGKECRNSVLYKTLKKLKPDVILFDLIWYMTYNFIQDFDCKKILLCRQVSDQYFSIPLPGQKLVFNPNHFDIIFATEPFKSVINMQQLNPIIVRNKDEIYSHDIALQKLGIKNNKPICLLAYNGEPGEYKAIKKKYSYLEEAEYQMLYSTNYSGKSYFPIADYFNAFDFIISGAGYNAFWEIIYFNKEAVFEPVPRHFEDQYWRVQNCQEYYFEENGADQLVDVILKL